MMKIVLSLARIAAVLGLSLMEPCIAAQEKPGAPVSAEESLKRFLQTKNDNKDARYVAAFRDLNGDGALEAIVYILSNEWCGSAGCNTFILAPDGDSWRTVVSIAITNPPIYVLENTSKGWHSIGVWVQGGGIRGGYEAELLFNGRGYPRNPSVAPARRMSQNPAGEVVITSTKGAKRLFDQ